MTRGVKRMCIARGTRNKVAATTLTHGRAKFLLTDEWIDIRINGWMDG